jgi:CubicO group peptidase (beta-lactamase class C family)
VGVSPHHHPPPPPHPLVAEPEPPTVPEDPFGSFGGPGGAKPGHRTPQVVTNGIPAPRRVGRCSKYRPESSPPLRTAQALAMYTTRSARQFWLVLLLPLMVAGAGPAAAIDAPGDDTVDRIEAHVAEGLRDNRVPGGALAVVVADGEVHLRGFGVTVRGGEDVTPDTPFVIGSTTKSMTALAILQLVEDGALNLDDPLAAHLDGFKVAPAAWTEQVTVRRLLEQTSGLPPLAGAPATTWLQDVPVAEAAAQVNGTELVSEPGTVWQYANANYVLLGALIEEVTGRPYADHLEQRLFAPLGMDRTTARLDEARRLGLPDGHRYVFGVPVAHLTHREGLVPAGLVVSTARDLGRYLQALMQGGQLDGERVLSEQGVQALFTPAAPATLGPWARQPSASYGFGWFTGEGAFGPAPVVFHPGATPDYGATAALVPSTSSGLVLLVNVGPRVVVPGAAGDIDRIGAGAVSLLTGSDPQVAGTVVDAYRVVTPAIALVLLLAMTLTLRRPSAHGPTRRHVAVATAIGLVGLAVLVLPTGGLGWRQSWLWAPDLTASAGLVGAAFIVAAARRLATLRAARREDQLATATTEPTGPLEAARQGDHAREAP